MWLKLYKKGTPRGQRYSFNHIPQLIFFNSRVKIGQTHGISLFVCAESVTASSL